MKCRENILYTFFNPHSTGGGGRVQGRRMEREGGSEDNLVGGREGH